MKGTRCSRFQAGDGVFIAQPDQAQTAAVTDFRVRLGGPDLAEQFGGMRTRRIGPVQQPGGSPFQVLAVSFGLMLREGGGAVAGKAARMAGHAQAFMKDFDHSRGEADVDLFAGQLIGNAIEVAVGPDMIVQIDLQFAPLADLITFGGKRAAPPRRRSSAAGRPRSLVRPLC